MDVVKRFLGLTNCHAERLIDNRNLQACLNGHHLYYLGYIFSEQPDSSEIQRACNCLINRQRKPFIFTFGDDVMVGIQEDDMANVVQLMMHRVVFSCVDAKNQKIVAVFYHNAGNKSRDLRSSGLECHLMLGKSKEHARKFAERIADELIYTYQRRKKFNIIKEQQEATRTFSNYVTYENFKPKSRAKNSKKIGDEAFNGSTSTFSKSSCTTVASVETEDQNYSSLWESLQDIDIPGESEDDPSSTPKPHIKDNIVQVHSKRSTTSRITGDVAIDNLNLDFDNHEFSCLIDLNETNI